MRGFMLAGVAAALLMTPMPSAQSDDVPPLSVEQLCRGIARHALSPSERGGPDLSLDQCIKGEQAIRELLAKEWSSFSPADKASCIGEATTSGESSYTDLLTCLEMARDVRNLGSPTPLEHIGR